MGIYETDFYHAMIQFCNFSCVFGGKNQFGLAVLSLHSFVLIHRISVEIVWPVSLSSRPCPTVVYDCFSNHILYSSALRVNICHHFMTIFILDSVISFALLVSFGWPFHSSVGRFYSLSHLLNFTWQHYRDCFSLPFVYI